MQRPAEISAANWTRLKTFAEPLEDDLDTVLNRIMTTVTAHEDCPGPRGPDDLPSIAQVQKPTQPVLLTQDQTDLHQTGPCRLREHPQEGPGPLHQCDAPPPCTGPQMADVILRYMHTNGGAVAADDVYRHILVDMEPPLNPTDMEVGDRPRWRKAADRGRQELKARGLIHPDVTPMPWRLTPEGRREAKHKFGPAPDPTSQAAPLQDQGAAAPQETPTGQTRAPADVGTHDPPQTFPDQTNGQAPSPWQPDIPTPGQESPGQRHTSQALFHLPILQILANSGGTAHIDHVMAHLEETMGASFTNSDLEPSDRHLFRWWDTMHNARLHLAKKGYILTHARKGFWQLTPEGWHHLGVLTGLRLEQTPATTGA